MAISKRDQKKKQHDFFPYMTTSMYIITSK